MAYIVLKLPTPIVYYMRNRDPQHRLLPFDPVVFSNFMRQSYLLRENLTDRTLDRRSNTCYSQNEWQNMLLGKTPDGKKQVVVRDSADWLSYEEVSLLSGFGVSKRTRMFDFLCIRLPHTIFNGKAECRVTPDMALSNEAANELVELIQEDFRRAYLDWEIDTFNFSVSQGRIIKRERMKTIERFLMRYDIPVPRDSDMKDSLRRDFDRLLKKAHFYEKNYRTFNIEDITYIDSSDVVISVKSKQKC